MLLQEKLKNKTLILASQSPRRKELLAGLDIRFETQSLNADESYPTELKREQITEYLVQKKANSFSQLNENQILITADTIVWLNGKALEKPGDTAHAAEMLKELSGKTHEVITSVGIFSSNREKIITDIAEVTFSEISDEEITYYVSEYQPFDKAGSYGVQEWIGYAAVSHLKGSYFTVMGFPVQKVYRALMDF